ncbi:nicotinamide riboside transporter PnuC [Microcoleus sp. ZQ-A2]
MSTRKSSAIVTDVGERFRLGEETLSGRTSHRRVHRLFPTLFPEKASFPYLDALTTIVSFTAMWLLVQKRIESWYYWIAVDVIGIEFYYVKGVRFIVLLYAIFLGMAINGLISWNKTSKTSEDLAC